MDATQLRLLGMEARKEMEAVLGRQKEQEQQQKVEESARQLAQQRKSLEEKRNYRRELERKRQEQEQLVGDLAEQRKQEQRKAQQEKQRQKERVKAEREKEFASMIDNAKHYHSCTGDGPLEAHHGRVEDVVAEEEDVATEPPVASSGDDNDVDRRLEEFRRRDENERFQNTVQYAHYESELAEVTAATAYDVVGDSNKEDLLAALKQHRAERLDHQTEEEEAAKARVAELKAKRKKHAHQHH